MSRHHRTDRAYQRLRRRLIAERGHRCERCGKTTGRLEVHHLKRLADGGTDAPANLQVLCRGCHIRIHRRRRIEPPGRAAWLKLRDALR